MLNLPTYKDSGGHRKGWMAVIALALGLVPEAAFAQHEGKSADEVADGFFELLPEIYRKLWHDAQAIQATLEAAERAFAALD